MSYCIQLISRLFHLQHTPRLVRQCAFMFSFPSNYPLSRHFVGDIHSPRQVVLQLWDFDGFTGFDSFLDWLENLENFFIYHKLSDSCIICYAHTSLVGSVKNYWRSHSCIHLGLHTITLQDKMKRILSNKYAHVYYHTQLLNQFILYCRQCTSIVTSKSY